MSNVWIIGEGLVFTGCIAWGYRALQDGSGEGDGDEPPCGRCGAALARSTRTRGRMLLGSFRRELFTGRPTSI
jgi:hypothetical protein